jgi:hypothetical protein
VPEFFIRANSFAAPFFSDESTHYVEADTPEAALEALAADYSHPAGLYAAVAYATADAFHKGEEPLAQWLCNKALLIQEQTADKGAASIYSPDAEHVEISGEKFELADPKGGQVVASATEDST